MLPSVTTSYLFHRLTTETDKRERLYKEFCHIEILCEHEESEREKELMSKHANKQLTLAPFQLKAVVYSGSTINTVGFDLCLLC